MKINYLIGVGECDVCESQGNFLIILNPSCNLCSDCLLEMLSQILSKEKLGRLGTGVANTSTLVSTSLNNKCYKKTKKRKT